jgi:hypothetical protein
MAGSLSQARARQTRRLLEAAIAEAGWPWSSIWSLLLDAALIAEEAAG